MRIIDFAVRRPVSMVIMVSVVIILGFFTLSKIAVDLLPDMNLPVVAVMTTYSGAGPEEVESQVTEPLEGIINNISNINELQSISSEGSSIIIAYFNWGTDMDNAALDVSEKTSMIEKYLPEGVEKPMIIKMDPTMMPIMQIGISGGTDLYQLQSIAEDIIEPRLARIPEIATVMITGGLEREIKIDVDPVKVENYGLSLAQVIQVLQMENFNMSGGKVEQGEREYYIRNLQRFETVEDIENVAIQTAAGNTVFLKDIATIEDAYKDNTQLTRVDGEYAVGVHCLKQTDANTVTACNAVRDELKQIQDELNIDINVKVVFDQAEYISLSLNNSKKIIVEGALLAMLVLFLFLRNARSTLIIFTAVPLSFIATFILMYFTNNTINLITLGGLALGLGRMVDDSIVVFENIYRHRMLGLSPEKAAVKGASEVGNAVIASTMTIIAVFFPIFFVEGIASILFKPLAVTISFAIFCSLIVALTIIPLMASRMLTDKSMKKINIEKDGRMSRLVCRFGELMDSLGERYKVLLGKSLRHRRRVIIIVSILMIASLAALPLVGAEFFPKMDSGEISITIESDKGSVLAATDKITTQAEEKLRQTEEVETIFTSVGSSSEMMMDSGGEVDKSTLYVKLCKKNERDRSVDEVAEEIRENMSMIAGAKIKVSVMDTSSMSGSSGPINIQIRGDDLDVLKELSAEITEIVRNVPGTSEVASSLTDGKPELQVKVDRQRAAVLGLSPMEVSSGIRNAMQGTVATQYKVEGNEIDVRVRYISEGYQDLDYLANLNFFTPRGEVVKLSQLATFEMAQGPISISRTDQVRQAEISSYLINRDLKSVIDEIQVQVGKISLPAGYEVIYGGENEDMMESFESLAVALLLAIILVYAVMAVQYESFFNPFVIMFSVPTAIIGVVLGLLLTGRTLSVPAFVGLIMLVGIVVSNAIIFVDYLKQLLESGMEREAAILEAGQVRLRPILMTAFSTILAMFPLSLGLGEGGEAQAPLATVVIGGLLISTLVTLVLVPVVYTIFDDWGKKLGKRFSSNKEISA